MTAPNHLLPLGAVAVTPSFPRSEARTDPTYTWDYRSTMAATMAAWVKGAMTGYSNTSQIATRHEAERRAVAEIKRPLHMPEKLLLASCVRDWLYAQATAGRVKS